MADVTITYKGSTIAEMSATGSKTLETAGTYCEDDISVAYVSPGGGGGTEPVPLDVDFIDYDGTLLYTYTAADFLNMSALPANPSHDGLTAQGWNWTLADAKAYVQANGMLVIGQNYATTDGSTHIYITLSERENTGLSIRLLMTCLTTDYTRTIDWGDGTVDTYSTSTAGNGQYHDHTYTQYGSYVIKASANGNHHFGYNGSGMCILNGNSENFRTSQSCRKIELGNKVTKLTRTNFTGCVNLEAISMPTSIDEIYTGGSGNGTFSRCVSLRGLVIPNGITSIPSSTFGNQESMRYVSFPKTITTYSSTTKFDEAEKITLPPVGTIGNVFSESFKLKRISLPGTYTTMTGNFLRNCGSLVDFTIPASVTTIDTYALSWPHSMKVLRCLATTPPTLSNARVVANLPADAVIYVPYSADHSVLAAYQAATNWSAGASKMVEEGAP